MLGGLAIALSLIAWGAQAVVPWRLRRREEDARRLWAYGALPLLLAGSLAALLAARAYPDAAVASGLTPLLASIPGRLIALFFVALLAADLVLALGRGRLESLGWPIAAAFGLGFLAAASFAAELLRMGEGPATPLPLLVAAAACRVLVGLAAGEVVAPRRPLLALAAGLALPAYLLTLPPDLAGLLTRQGHWLTAAAAALLLLAARWLPTALRRPALAAAILLAGLFFAQAAELSQSLAARPLPPLPELPAR